MTTEQHQIDKQALSAAPDEADMFWDAEDGERFGHDIDDIISDFGPGDRVKIDCAKRMPSIEVLVIEDGDDFTYQVISPTPPAEQQAAPKDDGFYEAINEMDGLYPAAPKAAPGEPYKDVLAHLVATVDAGSSADYRALQEHRVMRVARAVLSAAPQQEAQEPHGWLYEWTHSSATGKPDATYTAFTTDEAHASKHDNCRAIYTAPQPAPAPLSEPVARALVWSGTMWGRSDEVNEDDALELIRAVEKVHGITQNGGSNAE